LGADTDAQCAPVGAQGCAGRRVERDVERAEDRVGRLAIGVARQAEGGQPRQVAPARVVDTDHEGLAADRRAGRRLQELGGVGGEPRPFMHHMKAAAVAHDARALALEPQGRLDDGAGGGVDRAQRGQHSP
ncbi:hypothetical protein RZS08_26325, partial [Arthrospira platensis SPKY1]|nr:hypothetical protein [Arthrospira platensis SPKY1]